MGSPGDRDPGEPGTPDAGGSEPLTESTFALLRGQLANMERLLHLPGKAMSGVEKHIVPAWRRRTTGEARWASSAAVAMAIALQMSLPRRFEMPPRWLLPAVGGLLLVGLVIANPRRVSGRSTALRASSIVLTGLISLANAISAVRLLRSLLRGQATEDAALLLRWGGAIWLTNIVIFSLWYWELDRGGPAARAEGAHQYPDLLFPQMMSPEVAPDDWEPAFLDYFYLAFTNATAFSPTDVLPLTRWAKMLMLAQSAISAGNGRLGRGARGQHPPVDRPSARNGLAAAGLQKHARAIGGVLVGEASVSLHPPPVHHQVSHAGRLVGGEALGTGREVGHAAQRARCRPCRGRTRRHRRGHPPAAHRDRRSRRSRPVAG